MGQFGSAGLYQESPEVFWACTVEVFLLKTQASEDPCSIREMLFPFFDFKKFLIDIALSLPPPAPVYPMIRIEMPRGNSNHDGHHTDVNDEPGNEIDDNRPESRKMDEPHASNLSLSRS